MRETNPGDALDCQGRWAGPVEVAAGDMRTAYPRGNEEPATMIFDALLSNSPVFLFAMPVVVLAVYAVARLCQAGMRFGRQLLSRH